MNSGIVLNIKKNGLFATAKKSRESLMKKMHIKSGRRKTDLMIIC